MYLVSGNRGRPKAIGRQKKRKERKKGKRVQK
jgi:hypothetical protein